MSRFREWWAADMSFTPSHGLMTVLLVLAAMGLLHTLIAWLVLAL